MNNMLNCLSILKKLIISLLINNRQMNKAIEFIQTVFEQRTKKLPIALVELDVPYKYRYWGYKNYNYDLCQYYGYTDFRFLVPIDDFKSINKVSMEQYGWGFKIGQEFFYKPPNSKKIKMDPNGFDTVSMSQIFNMKPEEVQLSCCKHISPEVFGIVLNENGLIRGGEPD